MIRPARLLPALLLLGGCTGATSTDDPGTDPRPAECADRPDVTWDGWTHGFMTTYCAACHTAAAPDRHDAPAGMDFDRAAQAWAARDSIRDVVLTRATMPIGGGVLPDDLTLLDVWLDCSDGR